MRYTLLDGFRGFFLLFMGIIHLNAIPRATLGKLNHHYFGWVEDAQGFVFISGFVVGLVYGGIYLKRGKPALFKSIYGRARTIYSHQAGLILIFLAAALILGSMDTPLSYLRSYYNSPVVFTLSSLTLTSATAHMGILPMYIYFMLLTPFVLMAFNKGYDMFVLAVVLMVWLLAQTYLLDAFTLFAEGVIAQMGYPIRFGIFFNILGWQVLFYGGLWLGFRQAQGTLDLSFLKQPVYLYIFWIALATAFLLGIFDRVIFDFWISTEFSEHFLASNPRVDFTAIYVLAFAVDLFLITWLLVAGPECGIALLRWASRLVEWIFTRRFLVYLGQHSLHVFSYHILLVYVVSLVFYGQEISELKGSLILIFGAASLYIPAWLHAQMQARTKARKALEKAAKQETQS